MMKLPIRVGIGCVMVSGLLLVSPKTQATQVVRGPYLQLATPDSITIRWRTDIACDSRVRYGTDSSDLTFTASQPDLTTEHEVRLTGLTPSTRYFYAISTSAEALVGSDSYDFTTSPPSGQAQPTRIWVIGDAGQSSLRTQTTVRDAYFEYTGPRRTDLCLATGDNCLCFGTDEEYQTYFFDIFGSLFRHTPVWTALGNHETWGSLSPSGQFPYFDIFTLPANGEAGGVPSGAEDYYSFNYANIHFICLNSMSQSRATNSPMAHWLRADLAANTNQWLIAYWHHPPYTCGSHSSDDIYEPEMWEMRQNIVPILEAAGVDMVLSGHSHVYERSYLLHGHYGFSASLQPSMILDVGTGRESDTGPYIKSNTGLLANQGAVYVEVGCSASVDEQCCRHPVMFHTEKAVGSLVLDINSNRLDAVFLRDTGEIHDSFTLLKGDPAALRVCNLVFHGGNTILRWKSTPGGIYRVERTRTMQISDWEAASDPITAVGFTTCWTNRTTSGPIYLFRVVQLTAQPAKESAAIPTVLPAGTEALASAEWDILASPTIPDGLPVDRSPERRPPTHWAGEAVVAKTLCWKRRYQLAQPVRRQQLPSIRFTAPQLGGIQVRQFIRFATA